MKPHSHKGKIAYFLSTMRVGTGQRHTLYNKQNTSDINTVPLALLYDQPVPQSQYSHLPNKRAGAQLF